MELPASTPASLLQHRPFILYWNARIFASLAFQMVGVSVAWQMYLITGSAFDLGLVGLVQFLPATVLILVAGQLADRYDKSVVAKRIKFAEIFLILIAAIGLGLHSAPVLLACIFGLGVMSALFGPIKYGILPDHLVTEELPAGNALIEAGTFLSILLGIIS